MDIKQVIVMRHDLGMRRGKQIAQGAHASMAFLLERIKRNGVDDFYMNSDELDWLHGDHKKICCRVDSEEHLENIYEQAVDAGLTVRMITDNGLTEFNGTSTKTCLAIGPDISSKIDAITGDLKLL